MKTKVNITKKMISTLGFDRAYRLASKKGRQKAQEDCQVLVELLLGARSAIQSSEFGYLNNPFNEPVRITYLGRKI